MVVTVETLNVIAVGVFFIGSIATFIMLSTLTIDNTAKDSEKFWKKRDKKVAKQAARDAKRAQRRLKK